MILVEYKAYDLPSSNTKFLEVSKPINLIDEINLLVSSSIGILTFFSRSKAFKYYFKKEKEK